MRIVLAIVIAAVLSGAAAYLVVSQMAVTETARLAEEAARLESELADAKRVADRLAGQNEHLNAENESLLQRLDAVQSTASSSLVGDRAPDAFVAAGALQPEGDYLAPDDGELAGDVAELSTDDEGERTWGPPGRGWELTEEQRQEFATRMQERYNRFADAALATAKTKDDEERVNAILEYQNYFRDARAALREAETDEEREAIREEMATNQQAMRGLLREQQNAMLEGVAEQFGVTGDRERNAFNRAVRDVMDSPFFQMGGPGFGGGGPSFGGRDGGGGGGRRGSGGGTPR